VITPRLLSVQNAAARLDRGAHAGMNTLHRYYVSCIGYRFANVFVSSWLGSCYSHLPA